MTAYRPYQSAFAADVVMEFAGGARSVLGVKPTGAGKTVVFVSLARRLGLRTAILAHRKELIRQASAKLGDTPHGLILPGHPATDHQIQVGSIQTITRRNVSGFGLIICDEAHHAVAGQWRRFLESQPSALVLGVTATPERLDGRGLGIEAGGPFESMVLGPSTAELISAGYLAPFRVFAPPVTADLSRLHTLGGDFNAAELAGVMDRPSITGDVAAHYARHAPGQPAIAFCVSVAHAEHVAAAFRAAGWRSECVHGGLPADVRDARIAGLASGDVQVLTSCDLISEGLDIPSVGVVILLRATLSLGLFLQMVGRGLRPDPPGKVLVILDHAGNVIRHGMPDAPREWTLAGRPKRDKPPAVVQCPDCFAAHAPARECLACGHPYGLGQMAEAGTAALPEQIDGDLIEIKPAAPTAPIPLAEALKAASSYADIERIRKERGYRPGWTRYVMTGINRRRSQTSAADDFGAAPLPEVA